MRVMEALFFENKLITNNIEIVNSDIYSHANHFVIGYDELDTLGEWMKIPYDKANSENNKKRYSVDSFYEQLGISSQQPL